MIRKIVEYWHKWHISEHWKRMKFNINAMDYYIFVPFLLLSVIGIIMVYSASSNVATQIGGTPTGYLIKQSMFVVVSLAIILICLAGNNQFVRKAKFLGIFFIVLFVALILLKAFGHSVNGSAGWIPIGPLHVQPAEVAKVYIILRMAQFLSSREEGIINGEKSRTHVQVFSIFVMLFLVFIQPDLGGTVINLAIMFAILFGSGVNWRGATLLTSAGLLLGWISLKILSFVFKDGTNIYQIQRITAYSNPFKYANGIGQQLVNSYYALSNGGIFGVGLGNSIQKTGYLPEPNTDFIMAIIAEELGLIGVLFILFLLLTIIVRAFQLGIRSNDTYDTLICYGVGTYMLVQAYFNVGGVIGLLPITGVTFPFISYGGSSMLTLALCIGMILVISAKQKTQKTRRIRY